MSKTLDDLNTAFAGESQANRKYLGFAKKADEEGYTAVAKLFRVAAESETAHALKHLEVMGGISATKENLKYAIEGETYEFTEMYPDMIKTAEDEKNINAQFSFRNAETVEKEHADLYKKALDDPDSFTLGTVYVCQNCGHVHIGEEAPDSCPICTYPKKYFKKVE